MAAAKATQARARRTVARLLDAAVEEFAVNGYHGASVAGVAKRAGTSHGSFYVYFEDKVELLLTLCDEASANAGEVLDAMPPLSPGEEGARVLADWVHLVCRYFDRHAATRAALFEALSTDADRRLSRAALREGARWTGRLTEQIEQIETSLDPGLVALALHSLLAAATRMSLPGDTVDHRELTRGLAEVLQRAVFGTPTTAARATGG